MKRRARRLPRLLRALVAVMRAIPLVFTVSLTVLGVLWLIAGRTQAGLAMLAVALVALGVAVTVTLWERT